MICEKYLSLGTPSSKEHFNDLLKEQIKWNIIEAIK
jgi:hypothetical protein